MRIRTNLDLVLDWLTGLGLGDIAGEFFRKLSATANLLCTPRSCLSKVGGRTGGWTGGRGRGDGKGWGVPRGCGKGKGRRERGGDSVGVLGTARRGAGTWGQREGVRGQRGDVGTARRGRGHRGDSEKGCGDIVGTWGQ